MSPPKEASKHYGVSENALRMWANEGRIKYNKTKEDIEDTYSKNQMKYTREQKNQMEKHHLL